MAPAWLLQPWWEDFMRLPGLHFRLPPPRFCVRPHHFGRARVEPLANHAVRLHAVLLPPFSGEDSAG